MSELSTKVQPSGLGESLSRFHHTKYRTGRLIGVGAAASVYEGRHRNGNRVAIKVLHPHIVENKPLRDTLLREGYVANRVDHPGAVRVLDDDTASDGSVFLVMEFLEGETLESLWERSGQRLPHEDVALFAHQTLDVLSAAHDQGIVHRDIKPANLFWTRDGRLKVLDFGIARLVDRDRVEDASVEPPILVGTPEYMPPEQARGRARDVDGRADIWAVGATMFTLISGSAVHAADTLEEVLAHASSRPVSPLRSVAEAVPRALAAVIDRALTFDRDGRWENARAMQTALEAIYPGLRAGSEGAGRSGTFLAVSGTSAPARGSAPESELTRRPPRGDTAPRTSWRLGRAGHVTGRPAIVVASAALVVFCAIAAAVRGHWSVSHLHGPLSTSVEWRPSAPVQGLAREAPWAALSSTLPSTATPNASGDDTPDGIADLAPAQPRPPPLQDIRAKRPPLPAQQTLRSSCDPPFRIDDKARRIPKPECL